MRFDRGVGIRRLIGPVEVTTVTTKRVLYPSFFLSALTYAFFSLTKGKEVEVEVPSVEVTVPTAVGVILCSVFTSTAVPVEGKDEG